MKASLFFLCLICCIQTFAQQVTQDPVLRWTQIENERNQPKPTPQKSTFNSTVFQKAADREMKRVNAEFAWIARREKAKKERLKKTQTK
jgi:hypothetical protein